MELIFVHGALVRDGQWWWGPTAALVEQRTGIRSRALLLPSCGETGPDGVAGDLAADAAALRSALDGVDSAIVVGHSYGGTVISGGGTGNPNVKALVFVGAFAPDAGETPGDLAGRMPGSSLGETLTSVPVDGGNDLYIRQESYHSQFAADSSDEVAGVMAVTQRPILESAFGEASGEPAWKTVPSWFLFGELDKNIPAAMHHFMADRAGSRKTIELKGGSHTVGIPEAAKVFDLIREAADTTTGK